MVQAVGPPPPSCFSHFACFLLSSQTISSNALIYSTNMNMVGPVRRQKYKWDINKVPTHRASSPRLLTHSAPMPLSGETAKYVGPACVRSQVCVCMVGSYTFHYVLSVLKCFLLLLSPSSSFLRQGLICSPNWSETFHVEEAGIESPMVLCLCFLSSWVRGFCLNLIPNFQENTWI